MNFELNAQQLQHMSEFSAFSKQYIAPIAEKADQDKILPRNTIEVLAQSGYLGAIVPGQYGGLSFDMVTFGLLARELGRYCSSVRSLLTVHCMVIHVLNRWGTSTQRANWLPKLAKGKLIAAFGLTESDSGSDVDQISTRVELRGSKVIVTGTKKWISFGEIADVILVFGKLDEKHIALLVPRSAPNLTITPINHSLLGARASMLTTLKLDGVILDDSYLIGKPGFGQSAIGASALDNGRFTVAWGSLGMAQNCLDSAIAYASQTYRFGRVLIEQPQVARMITEMVTNIQCVQLLCLHASKLKEQRSPDTIWATYLAKYASTKTLSRVSKYATQILGARGCLDNSIVARAYRDAKIMEVIEGSSEIHERVIAELTVAGGYGIDFSTIKADQ